MHKSTAYDKNELLHETMIKEIIFYKNKKLTEKTIVLRNLILNHI